VLTYSERGFEQNRLIRALPSTIRDRWSANLTMSRMPTGMILSDPGEVSSHVCFPTTAIVSLVTGVELNGSAEIAVVGNEGMIGVASLMGGDSMSTRAVVNSPGIGYRMDAAVFRKEIARSTVVLHLMLRFTQALITQMAQTALCNRHHSLSQQVSRLLLLMMDRSRGNELTLTQGMIASMIGVRRESVTEAAQQLQRNGFIRYSRGHLLVLDRHALEQTSCVCYKVVKQEYDRLIPLVTTER
jgi:CRP-like cAMP-binding protein